ncbi:hypothetical protein AKJ37_02095 [candidate division MSBL1 archaeon SCGC-AAA259I09]|uniref:FAD/NAD(P)-binding domain-containing protein n=2 Tax=candidate division MSBL1 TaxID=215777 RepID=A0A133UUS0_9EURY|nr:hypothetical protein AKJ66_01590 [candidate division MSBL1 archaeon SCGC-AAA259E22]KXA97876.1 hypothetical protein AKJ37_02095 [candidate division MSBL1 archaeon SCGC-AAA259I09]
MKIAIIGAGPAGVNVVETFRRFDRDSEIVMFSDEPYPPYSPPAMMKYFQTGRELHYWKGKNFPDVFNVEYNQGAKVDDVYPDDHSIQLDDGKLVNYDKLVIASGGRLYAAKLEEFKEGVYNFKSLSAAEDLFGRVKDKKANSALVIGAGFIGTEVGLLLKDMGLEVTQLVRSRVMRRMLDPETSKVVLEMIKDRGIKTRRGDDADAVSFVGEKRAEGVKVKSGDVVTADLLIAATGMKPNIEFLDGSSIETDWGVIVDDHLRTNYPDIYAAGDVAEDFDRFTGERTVHAIFPNAVDQGKIVAYNLLGREVTYEGSLSMNSLKHLGVPVIAAGSMEGEEIRRRTDASLRKIYLKDDKITGFRLTGDISSAGIFRTLLNKKVNVESIKDDLLKPNFGMGYIEEVVRSASHRI